MAPRIIGGDTGGAPEPVSHATLRAWFAPCAQGADNHFLFAEVRH